MYHTSCDALEYIFSIIIFAESVANMSRHFVIHLNIFLVTVLDDLIL